MNRNQRKSLSISTLDILKKGKYQFQDREIDLTADLSNSCQKTYSISNDKHQEINIEKRYEKTIFSVVNETTLNGIEYANQKYTEIGVLNFASAKNPGGGFLSGSQAQEESLARSSGLYISLNMCSDYYEYHRNLKNPLYSDYMIVSPKVPFFRNDKGELREKPILCTVFTSPAVNKGAIREKKLYAKLPQIMRIRTKKLLTLAYQEAVEILILGAWGCGVFQNDPKEIAEIFKEVITTDFMGSFKEIRFSVLDRKEDKFVFNAFQDSFTNFI